MSEQQKLFASLSGALVAHLIFFLLVFGFLSTRSANSSSARGNDRSAEAKSREITVLISDLMERVKVEPAPLVPPIPAAREFVTTDLNAPEAAAPPEARFESDRNTSAASALSPDETQPQEDGPTLAGKSPLERLTLANRDFTEGDQPPAPAPVATIMAASTSAVSASASSPSTATPGRDGADDEDVAGVPLDPIDSPADRMKRPENDLAVEEMVVNTRKSFVDPNADNAATELGPMTRDEDRVATTSAIAAETGEVGDPVKEKSLPDAATDSAERPALKPVDEGLFSDSFSPEERQNVLNGSLARKGREAVDAEATALGKYKKSVRDAISQKWHRYKQDNADFVTWGILKLEFSVDRHGQVNNLQITKNEANAILAEFSLKAIREAKLPPMPDDVAKSVGAQGLVIHYDIIIY